MNRSSKGCWTCRIRHRKCDEAQPHCRECTDRHIQCHGYGAKPSWVDDQSALQAELDSIKRTVNQNFRRRKREKRTLYSTPPTTTTAVAKEPEPKPTAREVIPYREAQLLVHYLDYIFPLQYPYYEDIPESGGRGWLFWLLQKNGPLHQAILTLSALHQYTKFSYNTGNSERELIEYHTKALQGLRQALIQYEKDGFEDDHDQLIEFLACGCALISFEVFLGGTANWQPHLNALTVVVERMSTEFVADVQDGIEHAKQFLVAIVIWFELIACTSSATAPKVNYQKWLTSVDLCPVMGCQNRVMIAIGDIASLQVQRLVWEVDEIPQEVLDIQRRLKVVLEEVKDPTEATTSHLITQVYACAALVQLYTMAPAGTTLSLRVLDAVEGVINAIKRIPKTTSLRALTWAMCVSGSMAVPAQQPFFEDTLLDILGKSGPGFSNCDTVLRIIRQCWYHRETYPGDTWNWRDAMRAMGMCALLV